MTKAIFAFFLSIVFILGLRQVATRVGLVDYPGGRKKHLGVVPLVGGVGFLLSFFAVVLIAFSAYQDYKAFLFGVGFLGLVGVLDDFDGMSPRTKFVFQVVAAIAMTSWGDVYLKNLGNIFGTGDIELKNFGIPITLFAVVAVINAVNMFDGLDGLAATLSLAILGWFIYLANLIGQPLNANFVAILFGAVCGFLIFNWPAKSGMGLKTSKFLVFMGDAGSMVLGFSIAWFAVDLSQKRIVEFVPPVVMLWVLGVILIDMLCVTLRRLIKGKSPFVADRTHLHHFLHRAGYSNRAIVVILLLLNLLFGLVGVSAWRLNLPESYSFLLFLACTALYLYGMQHPRWVIRMLKSKKI